MACSCSEKTTHTLQIREIIKHGIDAFSFDCIAEDDLAWSEGDYIKWFVDVEGSTVGQKYSFATMPSEHFVRLTTRIAEQHSDYKAALAMLKAGDFIKISDPVGDFKLKREKRPLVMLSNGVGIATVRSLVKAYLDNPTDILSVYQLNVDAKSPVYKAEFDGYAQTAPAFNSHYVEHRADFYATLNEILHEIEALYGQTPIVYVVGSYFFGEAVTEFCKNHGVDPTDIYRDGQADGKGNCSCATVNRPITIQLM